MKQFLFMLCQKSGMKDFRFYDCKILSNDKKILCKMQRIFLSYRDVVDLGLLIGSFQLENNGTIIATTNSHTWLSNPFPVIKQIFLRSVCKGKHILVNRCLVIYDARPPVVGIEYLSASQHKNTQAVRPSAPYSAACSLSKLEKYENASPA